MNAMAPFEQLSTSRCRYDRFTIIAIIGLYGPFFSSETTRTGPGATALRARARLNLHRRLKITMIRRRIVECIPLAIGGRSRMINKSRGPYVTRNTRHNTNEINAYANRTRRRSAIDGRGKERRTTTEEEDPDVSNEYLIANPISNVSFGSPRNECEPLSASRGPPRVLENDPRDSLTYLCGASSQSRTQKLLKKEREK